MATERIEQLISAEALASLDALNAKVGIGVIGIEKLIARGVELNKALGGATTFKEINKGAQELTANEKALTDQLKQLEAATARLNALNSQQAKELAAVKLQQQERNKAIKEEIQLNQAAEGSIAKKQVQLKQLQRQYDNLSAAERNAARGQELLKSVQALDKELKDLEGSTGRFQRKVGDYANAFAGAITPVNKEIKKIQDQMKGGAGGQQLQSLQKQEQLLQNITELLGKEFSSTREQMRAFQEAAQQLGVAFGHESEVFQDFTQRVGQGVDAINDIRDSIKLAASDTRELDRLIGAATAIAGGFSIAQGAAALFGKENEDVQKALLKVQAVMAILNGLQAIQNELKNKDSILRKLTGFLIKEETKGIQAQAAAQNTNAAATNNATKSVKGFGLALKSIGIGLLLTLIPLVTSAMSTLSKSAVKVDKDLKGMGETAGEIADTAIKQLEDEIQNLNDSLGKTPTAVDRAKKALKLLEAEGKSISFFSPDFTEAFLSFDAYKGRVQDLASVIGLADSRSTENAKKQAELRAKIAEAEFLQKLQAAQQYIDDVFAATQNAIRNDADLDKDAQTRKLNALRKNFEDRKISELTFLKEGQRSLRGQLDADLQIINSNLQDELAAAGSNLQKRAIAEGNARKDRIIAERNFQDALTALIEEAEKKRRKLVATTIQGIVEIQSQSLSKMAEALNTITSNPIADRLGEFVETFRSARKEIEAELKALRHELAETALATFNSLVFSSFDSEKNAVQEQINLLEQKKQKEIETANATITNAQDRAAAIQVIEARAQANREALERRQREIDVNKAKFEKAAAVLAIAIDTFQKVAAIKAQAALLLSNPATAPLAAFALSQIPFVIASAAIATTGIISKPIPRFARGTDDAPGGLSVVGDAGKTELVKEPGSKIWKTPNVPTVMNVPKHSIVYPDARAVLESGLVVNRQGRLVETGTDTRKIEQKLDKLTSVIKNKPVLNLHADQSGLTAMWEFGATTIRYVDDQTRF
jgi:hypothetical protein